MLGDKKISIIDIPTPIPKLGEVVIQMAASALCGSEMHAWCGDGVDEGNTGHEAAGVVIAAGPGVISPKIGQRVGVSVISGCGKCEYCAKGQYTCCKKHKFYGSMHAEQFLTGANACHILPDDIPWDVGVLLTGDGFGVPYHSNTKINNLNPDTIAIFGMGPIGLGNVMLQSYLGRNVIAVDINPVRLKLAEKLGADKTINALLVDAVLEIIKLTDENGSDVCIEAAGRPETLKQCFKAVKTGGVVLMNGEQPSVDLSPSEDFIRRDITAIGAWFYHYSEYGEMLKLYREGFPLEKLITNHLDLADAASAYALFANGKTGKVILRGPAWND